MDTRELEERAINILAQYRCKHLSWGAAIYELADLGLPTNAIVLLVDYEDR